jgi:hypothetical protein
VQCFRTALYAVHLKLYCSIAPLAVYFSETVVAVADSCTELLLIQLSMLEEELLLVCSLAELLINVYILCGG